MKFVPRDDALETIKRDLVELQSALAGLRQQSTNVMERQIVDQPFQSLVIAFLAGFLCSRLLPSRLF